MIYTWYLIHTLRIASPKIPEEQFLKEVIENYNSKSASAMYNQNLYNYRGVS